MYWSWLRLGAAATALSGVGAGYIVNVDRATRQGQDLGLVLANYFSMFTIVSAILTVGALTAAAVWSMQHPGSSREPFGVALGIAGVTGPVILLGVVFNVLLRGAPSGAALSDSPGIAVMDSYATEVLHVVLPLYLLVDLVFATRRRGLPWWSLSVLIGYPVVWILYTMVRGELTPDPSGATPWWYPYPFLDPHGAGGWMSAFTYIAVLTAALVGIGAIVIAVGRYRERRATTRGAEAPKVGALQA
ncbi:Pr6Pr family membrane protein [Microbacterium deminutum]|uniref:Pr6Pr family membrane protein n=1 Tax=Microbacterium deminutum TaxID=344164 RepID=A0ABP5C132_9MICO